MAGMATMVGGCASLRGGDSDRASTNPTAQRTQAAQHQSEDALARAQEAQRRASEQGLRVAEAQAEVQRAQQALVLAQDKARAEHKKAEELQRQASQATKEASRDAQQSQLQAEQAIHDGGDQLARGEQSTSGHVTSANAGHVTVLQEDGSAMTFRVTGGTQIMRDGRPSKVGALTPGEQALVDYKLSAAEPIALLIQVASGNARHTGTASARTGTAGLARSGAAQPGPAKPRTAKASAPGTTGACECDVAGQSKAEAGGK